VRLHILGMPRQVTSVKLVRCAAGRRGPKPNNIYTYVTPIHTTTDIAEAPLPYIRRASAYETRVEAVADSYFQLGGSAFTHL
jgi:hypothetical protein